MSKVGARIIESLKQAAAGDFARVTIDGQTWVRLDREQPQTDPLAEARRLIEAFAASVSPRSRSKMQRELRARIDRWLAANPETK